MTQMGDSIRRRRGFGRGKRAGAGDDLPGTGRRTRTGTGSLDLKRWILGGVGGTALAFLVGWLIATQILFPKPALAGDEVTVPDLAGMTFQAARDELASARLEVGRVREMVHPDAAVGEVIAQDPLPEMLLKPGAEVRLAVSRGRARATVPDLVGMPADAAIELARRIGFRPERMEQPTMEEAGTVLRTRPTAGQQVQVPAPLTIVVSAGGLAPPDTAPLPPIVRDSGLVDEDRKVPSGRELQTQSDD